MGEGGVVRATKMYTCMTLSMNNLIKMQKRILSRIRQCIGSIGAGLSEDSEVILCLLILTHWKKNEPANCRVGRQGRILKPGDRGEGVKCLLQKKRVP